MNTLSLTHRLVAAAASIVVTFGLLSATVAEAGLGSPASTLLAQGEAAIVR
ncbi:MAG: hypothetical protein M3Z16_04815 [Pseudomonadota bacterium]|nr:hypothetical protein [Pseudomonadota bacterium]